MAKKIVDKNIEEIKKGIETKGVVLGREVTLKSIKRGLIRKVFMSSTVDPEIKSDVEQYAKISPIEIVELVYPNDELGALCKKPFPISIVGVLKAN